MRKTTWILTLLLLSLMAEAQVVWFDGKTPVTYSVPKRVEPVVKTALEMWKSDMRQVTGMEPVASAKPRIKVVQGKGAALCLMFVEQGIQLAAKIFIATAIDTVELKAQSLLQIDVVAEDADAAYPCRRNGLSAYSSECW